MEFHFKQVQGLLDNYMSAIDEQDVERFLASYASDIHLYDSWDEWECNGISTWRANVQEWFNGLKEEGVALHIEFKDLVVEEGQELAFARCAITFAAKNAVSGEELRQVTNRFTFCLRKANDSWLIIHEHSSLPIEGETGKGIFLSK